MQHNKELQKPFMRTWISYPNQARVIVERLPFAGAWPGMHNSAHLPSKNNPQVEIHFQHEEEEGE